MTILETPDIIRISEYIEGSNHLPLFLSGEAQTILPLIPDHSIDCCMTSPPYWNKREYANGGLGLESSPEDFIRNLLGIFAQIHRVVKDTGSVWLNIGDSYVNKAMIGVPWRLAIKLMDEQGWILRNDVIWNKIKGPDNTNDKLRNTHEHVFHFVKNAKGYYYDAAAIRSKPRLAQIKNGAVISATGVTGIRYKRQIELSTSLSLTEKEAAFQALRETLNQVALGAISDFRMVIRNQQRTTHSDSERLSGRAKELAQKGFYFLRYHPDGSKPSDVWEIMPEDTQSREDHYAPYPEDLCRIPLLATCPPSGLVLDPFCGTGTTNVVAKQLFRRSIGIDISQQYVDRAVQRCHTLL